MNLYYINHNFRYEAEKLLRLFFPLEKIVEYTEFNETNEDYLLTRIDGEESLTLTAGLSLNGEAKSKIKEIKKSECDDLELELLLLAYDLLCEMCGFTPKWGILTGVRPSKLIVKRLSQYGEENARDWFLNTYKVSPEKTELAINVAKTELKIIERAGEKSFSLYISIPFCPTRCSYCSFVSHSINSEKAKSLVTDYIEKLIDELTFTAQIAKENGLRLTSVYWGGGTPTTLSENELDRILTHIESTFDLSECLEYTVEAGRPDTITKEKLDTLKKHNVGRISINPQTFSDSVLNAIGRKHTTAQTEEKFLLAKEVGFDVINMDLIAGLPTDTVEDFKNSVNRAIDLGADNITVHTLALKRSSSIVTENESDSVTDRDIWEMLAYAGKALTENGYHPYYMYRQSKSLGNLENVGWCKKGKECFYNVLMMEEYQSIFSVGAGAVTKLRSEDGSIIERIFNFKYPFEYISRFDEIIDKKERMKSFYSEELEVRS
ncbi:MAG: coproporphyrinogen dehydrogenase HemZ [Clostridia bacterium]|nr:coproporphyrinogen dehydrogenase HemZ [Clostridia bacterium]